MADGSIKIDTKLLTDEFKKDFGLIKKSLATLTASATAFGVASINTGRKFERAMSQVGATMGLTVDEIRSGTGAFAELSKAAREAGKNTEWSASEAAEALNYMALAGYNAEKSIKTLPTVLNLASAGALDLARASDMITDAMSALGLNTENVGDFADVLVKASQKANASVGEFGEAILTIGATGRILKGGVVELTSALGVLANAGYKGAQGGTVLRNVILSLTAPTSLARKQMEKLGISAFDSAGNMRNLQDILNDFNMELGKLSQEEREDVLNNIFNRREIGAVKLLLANINDEFNELQGNLREAGGTTNQTAKVMKDNLTGALKDLRSKFEELSNTLYEKVGPVLKNIVSDFAEFITELTESDSIKRFGSSISSIVNALSQLVQNILPMAIGLFNVLGSIIQFVSDNAQGLFISFVSIKTAIIGMKIATLSWAKAWEVVKIAMVKTGVGALIVALGLALQKIIDNLQEIIIWTKIGWESLKNFIANIFTDTDKYANKIKELREELQKVKEESKNNEFDFDGEKFNEQFNKAVQGMNSFGNALDVLNQKQKETSLLSEAFEESLKGMANSIDDAYATGFQNLLDGFEEVGKALANGENAFKALAKSAVMSIGEVVSAMGSQLVAQGILDMFSDDPTKKANSTGAISQGTALKVLAGIIKANAGKFANGGIVGGSSYTGDKLTANVNSGELILNMAQQDNIAKMLMSKANAQPLVNIQVINNTNSQVGIQQDELNNIKILIDTEINQYMTGSKGEKMLSSNYGIRKVGIR